MKGISLCSDFYRQGLIVKENLVFSPQIDFLFIQNLPRNNIKILNRQGSFMDDFSLESSLCSNCGYMPGAWLPGLQCPECGEMFI